MEFLMTYGWAILAVMVMIGALAYFGVISPGRFQGDKCLFQAGMTCTDYSMVRATDNTVNLNLVFENDIGQSINTISGRAGNGGACTTTAGTVSPDNTFTLTCNGVPVGTGRGTSGSTTKVNVTVIYRVVGGTYDRQATGDITAKVQ